MKLKSILRIAAFSITFIFSAAFAGLFVDKSEIPTQLVVSSGYNDVSRPTSCFGHRKNNADTAAKINYLLQKDDDNGNARNAKVRRVSSDYTPPFASDSSFDAFAGATAQYSAQSSKIDFTGLPVEFKSAWHRHMKAWRDYADFLEAMKDSSVRTELGASAFESFDGEYNDEINQSWYEVLRVASENDVEIGKYMGTSD